MDPLLIVVLAIEGVCAVVWLGCTCWLRGHESSARSEPASFPWTEPGPEQRLTAQLQLLLARTEALHVHDNSLELMVATMERITLEALRGPEPQYFAPPPEGPPLDTRSPEELNLEDAADPLEVFLGADFTREDGAMWDEENPFGIPGLGKPE